MKQAIAADNLKQILLINITQPFLLYHVLRGLANNPYRQGLVHAMIITHIFHNVNTYMLEFIPKTVRILLSISLMRHMKIRLSAAKTQTSGYYIYERFLSGT